MIRVPFFRGMVGVARRAMFFQFTLGQVRRRHEPDEEGKFWTEPQDRAQVEQILDQVVTGSTCHGTACRTRVVFPQKCMQMRRILAILHDVTIFITL